MVVAYVKVVLRLMFSLKHGNFELKSLFKENCFALPKIVNPLYPHGFFQAPI